MTGTLEQHHCIAENAGLFWTWITRRDGLALWRSHNLSNPSGSWTTPVRDDKGNINPKPNWQSGDRPERIITDPSEVIVDTPKEVQRFPVAIQRGNSMNLTLTKGSDSRVLKALAKAGNGSWYEFDYATQEAVIFVSGGSATLLDWAKTAGLHFLTEVFDMNAGVTSTYTLPPEEAVVAAYAQRECDDYNTWDYKTKYAGMIQSAKSIKPGFNVVTCGNQTAMVEVKA